eukprot:scaffold108459_cov57-Attheya_sp.AAC.1
MDAVEYDRVCSYVRKTMFRKVKFTLDKALDSVQKGSIGGSASWNCPFKKWKIREIKNCLKRAKAMYEDNNGIMPTLDEVLLLREVPIWDPEDDRQIVNNIGLLFLVDFMYGSIIDEAFVLLVLENNWDVLNGIANAEPKYTSRKFTSNKRNDGWSNEGIRRYNELQADVMSNRKEEFSFSVEEGIMNLLYENEEEESVVLEVTTPVI